MSESLNNTINSLRFDKTQLQYKDTDISSYVAYGFNLLENLDKYYTEADLEVKEKLVSSIFPERLIYENGKYRTNGTDNIISLLCETNKDFEQIRKEKASENGGDSRMVALTGIEYAPSF